MPRPARRSTESIFLNSVDQSRIWLANVELSASLPRLSVHTCRFALPHENRSPPSLITRRSAMRRAWRPLPFGKGWICT